ncbi:hypothetical protein AAG570_004111 [Ranatra chinensis]|uniref:PAP-associated domain-containing protein n=1 Tax=Ranatra chinensis TaxID=642074 RepID=A0ABD0Y2V2_9HEMI
MVLWKYLYIHVKTAFPKYGLYLVGSTLSGFGSNRSDVDMCLIVRQFEVDQRIEAISYLDDIQKLVEKFDFIEKVELIQAKVPILKFRDSHQELDVDLNCNNSVGIRNTHLLHCYADLDWRVRPLVLVVKLWADKHNINNAKTMTISSYSLALMVIHFLQCGVSPPVLPCLHLIYRHKFQPNSDINGIDMHERICCPPSENTQPLGELLAQFFKYYANFDYANNAISVRLGTVLSIEECRYHWTMKNDPHQWKYLCIEEPFDLTNTARSVYDPEVFSRIHQTIVKSAQLLSETLDLESIFTFDLDE